MKFVIDNAGDVDVGIDGFNITAELPNIGFDDSDWVEYCKDMLDELYNQETKGKVYTEEEWNIIKESEYGYEDEEGEEEEEEEEQTGKVISVDHFIHEFKNILDEEFPGIDEEEKDGIILQWVDNEIEDKELANKLNNLAKEYQIKLKEKKIIRQWY